MSGANTKFCHACGRAIEQVAALCPHCGRAQPDTAGIGGFGGGSPSSPPPQSSPFTAPLNANPYAADPTSAASPVFNTSADSRNMAMLAHLLGIFTGFIGPLIIWLVKKDQDPFVDDQGKESLNFQITVGISAIVLGIATSIICVTAPLLLALPVYSIVCAILGAVKAKDGVAFRYPLTIRMVT